MSARSLVCRAVLAAVLAGVLALPVAAEEAKGGKKKSPFPEGETVLQLAPLWVPVTGMRARRPGVAVYSPVTVRLTSQPGAGEGMCGRVPYLIEGFLMAMNDVPVAVTPDRRRLNLEGVRGRLLVEATRIAGADLVRAVEIFDVAPKPADNNAELLALCQ